MVIVLALSALFVASVALVIVVMLRNSWNMEGPVIALVICSLAFLVGVGIIMPCSRGESSAFLREVASVRDTLTAAREANWEGYERAALQTKVLDINREIAEAQYWAANPATSWFYNGRVLDLEPIQ